MSPVWVSILFTAGASTWIYTKFQRYSGNNTKQSVIAATIAGLVIFFVFYSITHAILK